MEEKRFGVDDYLTALETIKKYLSEPVNSVELEEAEAALKVYEEHSRQNLKDFDERLEGYKSVRMSQ